MLDIKVIREDPDRVRAAAIKKHFPDRAKAVDRILELDAAIRDLIPRIDTMRSEQKALARELGKLTAEERIPRLEEQKENKAELQALQERQRVMKSQLDEQLLLVVNIPDEDVPEGKDEAANVELRRVGELPDGGFEIRAHDELGEAQGWMDFKHAAQISGSRTYMLLAEVAELQDALLRYAVDCMRGKGFVLVDPPVLVKDQAMQGTAFFPGGEEQTYRCDRDGLNLIGTSEVPVTSIHGDEILTEKELPKLYVGRSYCFRREAGTYGKDTKGLFRVHQFQKVEQVIVDVADTARSQQHHEDIVRNAEEILKALELPYRVVLVCGGDLGVPQIRKYDIECWMPSRQAYGETHSASRFGDFQARRLNMRYRRQDNKKVAYCHTLNNTVLASPRILIPMLEVHQQKDGRVRIPKVLVPYMGGRELIGRALA